MFAREKEKNAAFLSRSPSCYERDRRGCNMQAVRNSRTDARIRKRARKSKGSIYRHAGLRSARGNIEIKRILHDVARHFAIRDFSRSVRLFFAKKTFFELIA